MNVNVSSARKRITASRMGLQSKDPGALRSRACHNVILRTEVFDREATMPHIDRQDKGSGVYGLIIAQRVNDDKFVHKPRRSSSHICTVRVASKQFAQRDLDEH